MATIIVPVDFSENSVDAAQFAIDWAAQLQMKKIILYHSAGESDPYTVPFEIQVEGLMGVLEIPDGIRVQPYVEELSLARGVAAIAEKAQATYIVMGITGRNKIGQKLIGSEVFKVSEQASIPVLVVPARVRFKAMKNIALALPILPDLRNQVPHEAIKTLIHRLSASLMIVNIGRKKDKTPKSLLYSALHDIFDMFDNLDPAFHFLTAHNTVSSVAEFVETNHADLLVCVSGKYGFLKGMFKSSVSRKLAYHSQVPLMIYRSLGNE